MLALAIAASIPGITQAGKLADSVKTMECGLAIALDDIANGNVTKNQDKFFFGINSLMNIFSDFKTQLGNIRANVSSVGGAIGNVISTSNSIKTSL